MIVRLLQDLRTRFAHFQHHYPHPHSSIPSSNHSKTMLLLPMKTSAVVVPPPPPPPPPRPLPTINSIAMAPPPPPPPEATTEDTTTTNRNDYHRLSKEYFRPVSYRLLAASNNIGPKPSSAEVKEYSPNQPHYLPPLQHSSGSSSQDDVDFARHNSQSPVTLVATMTNPLRQLEINTNTN
jgi:hypothetical protein